MVENFRQCVGCSKAKGCERKGCGRENTGSTEKHPEEPVVQGRVTDSISWAHVHQQILAKVTLSRCLVPG